MKVKAQHNYAVAALAVCAIGLGVELSRPDSPIGWTLRKTKETLLRNDQRIVTWKRGTLSISEMDIDIMVRTTIGEAALEPQIGKIAVIWVMLNRASQNISWYGGNNVADVALHKATVTRSNGRKVTVWQFEPWMTRRDQLWGISKHSTIYKEVRELVVDCISGKIDDPTHGATHFLEPNIVRARRGGTLPQWASGNGKRIGRHVFFKPGQPSV